MEYPGVLMIGKGTPLDAEGLNRGGCSLNTVETAKSFCDNSTDCKGFMIEDTNSKSITCFASDYGKEGGINKANDRVPNAAFFAKVPMRNEISPTGTPVVSSISTPVGVASSNPIGSPISQ